MTTTITDLSSCKHTNVKPSPHNAVADISSRPSQQITSNAFSFLTTLPAIMLVAASAGLGCLYAWQSGIEHGIVLAVKAGAILPQ